MVANTFESCTATTLSYLLITANSIELEKVSLSDMLNFKTVC